MDKRNQILLWAFMFIGFLGFFSYLAVVKETQPCESCEKWQPHDHILSIVEYLDFLDWQANGVCIPFSSWEKEQGRRNFLPP